ncbi:Non-Catalytic module family EXPN protein [Mycena sanguinolenta]|uniref:Non-Catalytic module family EXPN protein n=1 Tax=Mycena sanguinolenta TaxID=230812 RepID=A0A8H6XTU1_9AGAR|nr:Non-Catalytic module family EXPN protein [Mycena sanguinolenta]
MPPALLEVNIVNNYGTLGMESAMKALLKHAPVWVDKKCNKKNHGGFCALELMVEIVVAGIDGLGIQQNESISPPLDLQVGQVLCLDTGSSGGINGIATYYDPNGGSCGNILQNTDSVVALGTTK